MQTHIRQLLAPAFLFLLAISPLLFISRNVVAGEATDRAALEAAAQAWTEAFNARDADAMAALATDDVVLLDPTLPPLSGREAARGAWQQAVASAQAQVTAATKEAVIHGDLAWRIGAFAHELPSGDAGGSGQSLEIWKRVDGKWKLHRQMSSSILAQPKLLRRPDPSEPVLDKPGK